MCLQAYPVFYCHLLDAAVPSARAIVKIHENLLLLSGFLMVIAQIVMGIYMLGAKTF